MRTGKAKQHYLQNEVIAYIKRKTRELKKKSQSAYLNGVFLSMIEQEKKDKEAVIKDHG